MKNRKSAGAVQRSAGRRRRRQSHRRSVMMISMVLLLLCGVLTVNSVTLQAKNDSYKEQEKELTEQIEEQKTRSEEVRDYEEYVKTDEYVKETAEDKLGLVDPDEIIFKPVK